VPLSAAALARAVVLSTRRLDGLVESSVAPDDDTESLTVETRAVPESDVAVCGSVLVPL